MYHQKRRSVLNSAGELQGGGIFTPFYTINFRGLFTSGGARAPAAPPSSAPMTISHICIYYLSSMYSIFYRYMIATRDIEPLELILKEDPAVVGPYSKSGSGCLHCLKKVDGSYLCSGCQFPMCDSGM